MLTNMVWKSIRSLSGREDTVVVSKWYRAGKGTGQAQTGISDNFGKKMYIFNKKIN